MAEEEVLPVVDGEQNNGWMSMGRGVFQMFVFYNMMTLAMKFFGGGGQTGSGGGSGPTGPARNIFPPGQLFDMYTYLSPAVNFSSFDDAPVWARYNLSYDWALAEETFSQTIPTPPCLHLNQSIFAHVFVVRAGKSLDPKAANHAKNQIMYGKKQLNRFLKRHYRSTSNLLTGESGKSEEELEKAKVMTHEVLNFWHPNLSISLVVDQTNWQKNALPEPFADKVKFSRDGRAYKPIVHLSTYWNLIADYHPVNETVKEINLTLTYYPMSLMKYQMYISQDMRSQWYPDFAVEEGSEDVMKQAMLETNPYLLGVTLIVSLLHTLFEFLAFKNDIAFWKSKRNLEGLSVRTVLWGVGQQVIVFLYVCDNDTNFMVKASLLVGIAIECWKVPKCFNITIDHDNLIFGLVPRVRYTECASYTESDTKEYDNLAFRYLSWCLYPLLIGYAIYSLVYEEQKGWYSWVLSTLYGFLLTFGFIMMTPQLFINYKLKSVAHLPWRMLTYKFINTFIDDLFAFVIRMPTMYRIGCFRDDIIFLVYVYQRWAYRIDHTRVNEFGTAGEEQTKEELETLEMNKKEAGDDQPRGGGGGQRGVLVDKAALAPSQTMHKEPSVHRRRNRPRRE